MEHFGVLGLGFISWKLQIRILRENQKESVFLQHINSLTGTHVCDDMLLREESVHFLSYSLLCLFLYTFSLSLKALDFLGEIWISKVKAYPLEIGD